MRDYVFSEIFWGALEHFIAIQAHIIETFHGDLMLHHESINATPITNKGEPMDLCVAFMDCTTIAMQRPGGGANLQRAVYSGHKRIHCLVYKSFTTPERLIFNMYDQEVGRGH